MTKSCDKVIFYDVRCADYRLLRQLTYLPELAMSTDDKPIKQHDMMISYWEAELWPLCHYSPLTRTTYQWSSRQGTLRYGKRDRFRNFMLGVGAGVVESVLAWVTPFLMVESRLRREEWLPRTIHSLHVALPPYYNNLHEWNENR